jgi:hypothetical protein
MGSHRCHGTLRQRVSPGALCLMYPMATHGPGTVGAQSSNQGLRTIGRGGTRTRDPGIMSSGDPPRNPGLRGRMRRSAPWCAGKSLG